MTIFFRSAAKPILAYFQQVKNFSGTWISETKDLSEQQVLFLDLKSGFIFFQWAYCIKRYVEEASLLFHLSELNLGKMGIWADFQPLRKLPGTLMSEKK